MFLGKRVGSCRIFCLPLTYALNTHEITYVSNPMLNELFSEQRKQIDSFFSKVDLKASEKLLQMMLECQGVIFFSGIGKSEFIAKKIAVTMTSTGTKALYLSPSNALHGDIGMVSQKDLFIFISKSGESDELLTLIPYLRNKGVTLVSLVCHPGSRLAKACDFTILLPLEKELCPFNLAPTTSAAIQLLYGDILAVALMRHKQVDLELYKSNHPAGRIGKRITLKVRDLMLKEESIPWSKPVDKLGDVLVDLSNKRCGCLLVTDDQRHLKGIFTDGDLRRALQRYGSKALDRQLEELMTKTPRWIRDDVLAIEAVQLMEADQKCPITVLPVLSDSKKVVGIIKMHDIIQSGL